MRSSKYSLLTRKVLGSTPSARTAQMNKPKIGFIGQGFVGKSYADNFEARGYTVIRYAKEKPYNNNKDAIKDCEVVFIAVPTPTTPKGFNFEAIREVLPLVGKGKIAIIKSTVLPGTTQLLQKENSGIIILCSPEFLRETSARRDVDHPDRNIIGIVEKTKHYIEAAEKVMGILPKAPYIKICLAGEAELTKYAGNTFLYAKIVYINMLYDLAKELGCEWDTIAKNMMADPRIGNSHMSPKHQSGRGAGGHCFIKDFAAFRNFYKGNISDEMGVTVLRAIEEKNKNLLMESGKDVGILKGVYNINKDK